MLTFKLLNYPIKIYFPTKQVPAQIISNGSTVRHGSVDSTCFQKSISTGQCPVKLRGLKMKEIVTPSQRVSFKMPKHPRLDTHVRESVLPGRTIQFSYIE